MATPAPSVRILLVEDEEPIRIGLCDVLAYHGWEPEAVERGDEGLERALSEEHALLLLDVMLPGLSGFEICEQARAARPTVPILMLTARGAEEDVLRGFRAGADDYVVKPFSVAELVARVEALLRRAGALAAVPAARPEPFTLGPWRVDPDGLVARPAEAPEQDAEESARRVDLTRRDVDVLALFAREAGRIVSRRMLLHEVWGYPEPERVETRSVDMHIAKLRRKLGGGDALIETVRGEGYRAPAA